jgi:16S rRNA (uracil1498-N3)-methyltransferase
MSAAVEGTQRRTGNLPGKDARILVGRDDIVGTVQDTCRRRDPGQALEGLVWLRHREELRREDTRTNRIVGTLPDLLLDERGMRSLKLRRVEHRARQPVRVLRRPRPFPKEGCPVSWIRGFAMATAGGRRREHQPCNTLGMIDDKVLRDQSAHRCAEHRGGLDIDRIEHDDGVQRHVRHGDVAAAAGLAKSARIERDHAMAKAQLRRDGIEDRAACAEPWDEQQRRTVSRDERRELDAVMGGRGQAFDRHDSTIPGDRCRTMRAAMPRFFVDASQIEDDHATLVDADAEHLARSLRARPGETIVIVAGGTIEHGVVLREVTASRVSGTVVWSRPVSGEPRLAVHVLQAIPAQTMDATVEALTVAGAASIRPVVTGRTVVRPGASQASRRVERWQAIAREAAQLAGRAAPPSVSSVMSLRDALAQLPAGTRVLACVIRPDATAILSAASTSPADVALIIGPEGGLDDSDLDALASAGAAYVHLGPRTLPSRLAGAVATALLLAGAGDLDSAAEPLPQ